MKYPKHFFVFTAGLSLFCGCTNLRTGQIKKMVNDREIISDQEFQYEYSYMPEYLQPLDNIYNLPLGDQNGKQLICRLKMPENFEVTGYRAIRPYYIQFTPVGETALTVTQCIFLIEEKQEDIRPDFKKLKSDLENRFNGKPIQSLLNFSEEEGIQIADFLYDGEPPKNSQANKNYNVLTVSYDVNAKKRGWVVTWTVFYPKSIDQNEKEALTKKLRDFKPQIVIG